MAKEFTAQGLKRPNHFENFKLSKAEKTGDGPKTEQKSFSLADMLNAPIPTNYIFVVPRQGGLVCMVLVGTIFKELKTTLETAVPALKPDENGVMSETFKEEEIVKLCIEALLHHHLLLDHDAGHQCFLEPTSNLIKVLQ